MPNSLPIMRELLLLLPLLLLTQFMWVKKLLFQKCQVDAKKIYYGITFMLLK